MNGTTRCPYCETRFKIAEAQLSAHQGMVRCGHCLQAFDAKPNYLPEQDVHEANPPVEVAESSHADENESVKSGESEQSEPNPENTDVANARFAPQHETEKPPHPPGDFPEDPLTDAALPLMPDTAPPAHEADIHPGNDSLDFSQSAVIPNIPETTETTIHTATAQENVVTENIAESDTTPEPDTPIIATQHELTTTDSTVRTMPKHRWLWLTGILFLSGLLSAQLIYQYRVSLAAHIPALKPALLNTCRLLGCQLPLPAQSELMSIESSSLDADSAQADRITFNALLRNRADYTQAFPVLALTLNDNQDKPLARRLFLPGEYLPTDSHEENGLASNQEVSVKLQLLSKDLKASGYRLELFYKRN